VRGAVVVADEIKGSGLDFRKPFEEMRAFLDSRALPEEQMSYTRRTSALDAAVLV